MSPTSNKNARTVKTVKIVKIIDNKTKCNYNSYMYFAYLNISRLSKVHFDRVQEGAFTFGK
ncbi:hypothetical protein NIES2109_26610 [Nostoc sp. HK-01]|nr:hypothetical protein NIES2109_26610 [Nostoc sp. HK-01]